jgi:hypothetical protein
MTAIMNNQNGIWNLWQWEQFDGWELIALQGFTEMMDGLLTWVDAIELFKIINSGNFSCILL